MKTKLLEEVVIQLNCHKLNCIDFTSGISLGLDKILVFKNTVI